MWTLWESNIENQEICPDICAVAASQKKRDTCLTKINSLNFKKKERDRIKERVLEFFYSGEHLHTFTVYRLASVREITGMRLSQNIL